MRLFVALEVQRDVINSLSAFQSELSATGADLKLVEEENLHFTVKFIGEVTEAKAEEAKARMGRLALPKGVAEVMGVGAFPNPTRARVVWAGVSEGHREPVIAIARAVEESLAGIGDPADRAFQAHLTLARVRSSRNSRELGILIHDNGARRFGRTDLTELKLKSSLLTPRGPIYSDIGVYPLV